MSDHRNQVISKARCVEQIEWQFLEVDKLCIGAFMQKFKFVLCCTNFIVRHNCQFALNFADSEQRASVTFDLHRVRLDDVLRAAVLVLQIVIFVIVLCSRGEEQGSKFMLLPWFPVHFVLRSCCSNMVQTDAVGRIRDWLNYLDGHWESRAGENFGGQPFQ